MMKEAVRRKTRQAKNLVDPVVRFFDGSFWKSSMVGCCFSTFLVRRPVKNESLFTQQRWNGTVLSNGTGNKLAVI